MDVAPLHPLTYLLQPLPLSCACLTYTAMSQSSFLPIPGLTVPCSLMWLEKTYTNLTSIHDHELPIGMALIPYLF